MIDYRADQLIRHLSETQFKYQGISFMIVYKYISRKKKSVLTRRLRVKTEIGC